MKFTNRTQSFSSDSEMSSDLSAINQPAFQSKVSFKKSLKNNIINDRNLLLYKIAELESNLHFKTIQNEMFLGLITDLKNSNQNLLNKLFQKEAQLNELSKTFRLKRSSSTAIPGDESKINKNDHVPLKSSLNQKPTSNITTKRRKTSSTPFQEKINKREISKNFHIGK